MRFSILLGLLPLALTMVDAKCFKRGTIGNKRVPENNLQEICAGLAGTYDSEMAPRRICVHEDGDSTSWYFATRRRKGKGYMAPLECTTWLGAEINGCEFGGQSKVGDWWVSADPEPGLCEDPKAHFASADRPGRARRSVLSPKQQHVKDFDVSKRGSTTMVEYHGKCTVTEDGLDCQY